MPGEWTCYKPGRLIFDHISKVEGLLPMESVKYSIDLDGSMDYGNIEGFRKIGGDKYSFVGDFGEVYVICSNVRLEIADA